MKAYDELARYYDLAFSGNIEPEIDWHLQVFGPDCRSVLEPACGSARWLEAFARKGLSCTGLDISPTMLERARARLDEGGVEGVELVKGDMSDFALGRRFDGALCPINTLSYLLDDQAAAAHLACMARHLNPGARYVVQLDLVDTGAHEAGPADQFSDWIVESEGIELRTSVTGVGWDPATQIETELMRFEVLSGPEAGRVLEDRQSMRLRSWEDWRRLVEASAFEQVAAHDARTRSRTPVEVGPSLEGLRLCVHELRLN